MNTVNRLVNFINKGNTFFLLLVVLCLVFLGIDLGGNEENYLAYSKLFISPDWIPNSFTLTDIPGTRIIFQYIFGFLLKFFSFEVVTLVGRLVSFILLAVIFTKIVKFLKITNLEILFVFLTIYFSNQSLFAGEWVFGEIEGKVFAYFFLFYSIYFWLKDQHLKAIVFIACSVYFHILVGGWFIFIYFIYLLFVKTNFKDLFRFAFIFGVIVSPFIIYLFINYFTGQPNIINGINISKIYVYIRNPHHMGIFKDFFTFRRYFMDGILISLALFMFCIFYFTKIKNETIKKLNTLNIILFSQQLLCITIAVFDHNGYFLKYYPFRTSTLSMFLMLIQLILFFKQYSDITILKNLIPVKLLKFKIWFKGFMVICALTSLIILSCNNVKDSINIISGKNYLLMKSNELYNYISENTNNEDVIFNYYEGDDLAFSRKTNREQFFVSKFMPTTNKLIYEWYMRYLEKQKALQDIGYITEIRKKYRIDYILSKRPLPANYIHVWDNQVYYLYK